MLGFGSSCVKGSGSRLDKPARGVATEIGVNPVEGGSSFGVLFVETDAKDCKRGFVTKPDQATEAAAAVLSLVVLSDACGFWSDWSSDTGSGLPPSGLEDASDGASAVEIDSEVCIIIPTEAT